MHIITCTHTVAPRGHLTVLRMNEEGSAGSACKARGEAVLEKPPKGDALRRMERYIYRCSATQLFFDPTNCSLSGSSVHGISQARILEWIAISLSRGSSQPRDGTHVPSVSCIAWWVLYRLATGKALQG